MSFKSSTGSSHPIFEIVTSPMFASGLKRLEIRAIENCVFLIKRVMAQQAIPEKNQAEGLEDMEFPGVSKKQHVEFSEIN